MLCPNCGKSVGDRPTLCADCLAAQEAARKVEHEEAVAEAGGETEEAPPRNLKPAFFLMGLGVLLLAGALLAKLSGAGRPSPSNIAVPAPVSIHKTDLETFSARCRAAADLGMKMRESGSKRSGGVIGAADSVLRGLITQSGAIEKNCDEQRAVCEQDYDGPVCVSNRQSVSLFAATNALCSGNDFKAMTSPECQDLFRLCVASQNLGTAECQSFLKRHGFS